MDSGLNSVVLASNNEMVLLPVNEPTHGTRRKSQIQVRACAGALCFAMLCEPCDARLQHCRMLLKGKASCSGGAALLHSIVHQNALTADCTACTAFLVCA